MNVVNGNGYHSTEQDYVQAEEAYINYAAGIAILSDPEGEYTQPIHQREVNEENVEAIIVHAERLIIPSLQDVIRHANPELLRSRLSNLEKRYVKALPNMQAMVRRVYKVHGERLQKLHYSLGVLRPAPFTDEETYAKLCHSRRMKLITRQLMGPLNPAVIFEPALEGRSLTIKQDADNDNEETAAS